ncbi:hypothetical protein V8F20_002711 [Naviculisporaceae sp. PSN 640]
MAALNPHHLEDPFLPEDFPKKPILDPEKRNLKVVQALLEKDLETEVKGLKYRIFAIYGKLRGLVAEHFEAMERNWRGLTDQQREALLRKAWKDTILSDVPMPSDRFPQATLFWELQQAELEGRKPSVDAELYKMHWILPQLNVPSLVSDRSFLVLLLERSIHRPWKFGYGDEARIWMSMKVATEFVARQLGGYPFTELEKTHGVVTNLHEDVDNFDEGCFYYGNVVRLTDKEACRQQVGDIVVGPDIRAWDDETRKNQGVEVTIFGDIKEFISSPARGMYVLQAQDFLYRFLLFMAKQLQPTQKSAKKDESPLPVAEVVEKLKALDTAKIGSNLDEEQRLATEWPYRNPKDLGAEYVIHMQNAMKAAQERKSQHMTGLRTWADHFRKFVTLQYLSYQNCSENPEDVIWTCVGDAVSSLSYWQHVTTEAEKAFEAYTMLALERDDRREYSDYTGVIREKYENDSPLLEKEALGAILHAVWIEYDGGGKTVKDMDSHLKLPLSIRREIQQRAQERLTDFFLSIPVTRPGVGEEYLLQSLQSSESKLSRVEYVLATRNWIFNQYVDRFAEFYDEMQGRVVPLFESLWAMLRYLAEQLHLCLWHPQLRRFLRKKPGVDIDEEDDLNGYEIIKDGGHGAATDAEIKDREACLSIIQSIRKFHTDMCYGSERKSAAMLLALVTKLEQDVEKYKELKTLDKDWHPWLTLIYKDIILVATNLEILETWADLGWDCVRNLEREGDEVKRDLDKKREKFEWGLNCIKSSLLKENVNGYTKRATLVAKDILGQGFVKGLAPNIPDAQRDELNQLVGHFWYCIHRAATGAPENEWDDHPYGVKGSRKWSKTQTGPPKDTDYGKLEPVSWMPKGSNSPWQGVAWAYNAVRRSYAWLQVIGDPDVVKEPPPWKEFKPLLQAQQLGPANLLKALEVGRKFVQLEAKLAEKKAKAAEPDKDRIEVARTPPTATPKSNLSKRSTESLRTPQAYAIPDTPRSRGLSVPRAGLRNRSATPVPRRTLPDPDEEGRTRREKKDSPRTAKRKRREAAKEKKKKDIEERERLDPELALRHRPPVEAEGQAVLPKRKFYVRRGAYRIFHYMLAPNVSRKKSPTIPFTQIKAAICSGMRCTYKSLTGSAFEIKWLDVREEDLDSEHRPRYGGGPPPKGTYLPEREKTWHKPHARKGCRMGYNDYRHFGEELMKCWDWTWDRFALLSDLTRAERRRERLAQGYTEEEIDMEEEEGDEEVPIEGEEEGEGEEEEEDEDDDDETNDEDEDDETNDEQDGEQEQEQQGQQQQEQQQDRPVHLWYV